MQHSSRKPFVSVARGQIMTFELFNKIIREIMVSNCFLFCGRLSLFSKHKGCVRHLFGCQYSTNKTHTKCEKGPPGSRGLWVFCRLVSITRSTCFASHPKSLPWANGTFNLLRFFVIQSFDFDHRSPFCVEIESTAIFCKSGRQVTQHLLEPATPHDQNVPCRKSMEASSNPQGKKQWYFWLLRVVRTPRLH